MNEKMNWIGIERIYPIGSKITAIVEHHAPFGIFTDIGHPIFKGLVQITDFLDEDVMSADMYPPVGSKIEAVVLAFTRDHRNQIWLSMKPSILQDASK